MLGKCPVLYTETNRLFFQPFILLEGSNSVFSEVKLPIDDGMVVNALDAICNVSSF
jgi:hypothetical protein